MKINDNSWNPKLNCPAAQFQTIHLVFIFVLYTRPNLVEEKLLMRKQILALFSAMFITGLIAMSMVVIGVNAMTNHNGTNVSNPTASASISNSSAVPSDQTQQIAELQAQIAQYQSREQQYQAALDSDNQQLSQAASELQMIQQLLTYLQSHGLIEINNQGQIFVTGR
jgi:L-asparagine transporter-like permease